MMVASAGRSRAAVVGDQWSVVGALFASGSEQVLCAYINLLAIARFAVSATPTGHEPPSTPHL